jgi:hypothetical protein
VKSPRIVVLEADGWLAKQLRELAAENRWLVKSTRSSDAVLSLLQGRCPVVLLVQFEPAEDRPAPLALIPEVHRRVPAVPVVAVADSKLPDAERAAWTAALLDLGARYVLFPPLTRVVLEDVVSGLMTATIRRLTGDGQRDDEPRGDGLRVRGEERRGDEPRPGASGEVIDLAEEDFEP